MLAGEQLMQDKKQRAQTAPSPLWKEPVG